jgi:hypothetical protein
MVWYLRLRDPKDLEGNITANLGTVASDAGLVE